MASINTDNTESLIAVFIFCEGQLVGFMAKMYISMVRPCLHGGAIKGGNKA